MSREIGWGDYVQDNGVGVVYEVLNIEYDDDQDDQIAVIAIVGSATNKDDEYVHVQRIGLSWLSFWDSSKGYIEELNKWEIENG